MYYCLELLEICEKFVYLCICLSRSVTKNFGGNFSWALPIKQGSYALTLFCPCDIIVPRTGIQYMYLSENVADLSAMVSRSSQVQSNCSYCMGARASYWLCIIWSYPSMGANGDCPWLLCNEGAIKSSWAISWCCQAWANCSTSSAEIKATARGWEMNLWPQKPVAMVDSHFLLSKGIEVFTYHLVNIISKENYSKSSNSYFQPNLIFSCRSNVWRMRAL
jgi:hypothetical protein